MRHTCTGRIAGLRRIIPILAALACLAAGTAGASDPPPEQQRALLDLVVNEVNQGQVLALVRAGDILIPVAALERAGVRDLAGRRETLGVQVFVSLASLGPDISYRFDDASLAIRVTVPPRMLGVVRIDIKNAQRPEFTLARPTSAFVNYGVSWLERRGYSVTAEAGLSVRGALASTTYTRNEDGRLVRGLSSVLVDDRKRLRRVVVGDSLVGDRLLGGSVFLGGVRVAREYSIDPYFVQFPMLGLSGAALTPSTIEVYVDNRLVRQERIQPGQFELANVPVPSGASQTRVVIRDAFGREQEMASPFYLTTSVLARGLQEYEYSVGFPRTSVGSPNDSYGSLAAYARHRYGFSDSVTAGVRAESDSGLISGGPTLNLRLPAGEVEAAVAGSRDRGHSGAALAFGYTYTNPTFSVGLNTRAYTASYSTLSLRSVKDPIRSIASAFAGVRLGRGASLNLQHSVSNTHGGSRIAQSAATVTAQVARKVYAFGRATRSRFDNGWHTEVSVGVSVALAARTNATASIASIDGRAAANFEAQRSLPLGEGIGYRLQAASGSDDSAGARLQYQSRYGRAEVARETVNGSAGSSATVAGGIIAIGGAVFASRPVEDGFAVIRVPGVGGVRGFLSNQEVGRTNRRGDLLIPNLLPYYANRLSIADQDVPLDHGVSEVEQAVAPPYRGGAVVVFSAGQIQGVAGTVTIVQGDKVVVPEFGDLVVVDGERRIESPVGRGGSFYLEDLRPGAHRATVRYLGASCSFTLLVPTSTSAVVNVGAVRCAAEAR